MILSSNEALDAVNEMIGHIGEAPVNTLENSENTDVATAVKILERVNRQVQSRGWSFNTVEEATLNPDIYSQTIAWQDDILFIVGTDGTKYIKRGDNVYDFDNQTDVFTDPIEVEIIREVDFEYMPFPVRDYIVAKASRLFNSQTLNDPDIAQELQIEEQEAWARLQEYELELNDWTMFDLQPVQELTAR
jgi:hypothetical protein